MSVKVKTRKLKPAPSRVLIVDDEPSVLLTYQLILQQAGYDVTAAATSVAAKEAITRIDFDIILTDFSLEQQHNGFEVVEAARQRRADVPSLLLTGYATKETADDAASRGIGVMFKPIDIEEFLTTTSELLRTNRNESNEKTGTQD